MSEASSETPPPPTPQVAGLRQRLSEARSETDRMRALAQSVATERDAATSHILTLQRELESHRAALSALQEQAEGSPRAVRGGGGLRG